MSVKMAVAKLCACAAGGAVLGGGAVHYAERARPAVVHSTKSTKQVKPVKVVHRKPIKRKRVEQAFPAIVQPAPIPLPAPAPMPEVVTGSTSSGGTPVVYGGSGGGYFG